MNFSATGEADFSTHNRSALPSKAHRRIQGHDEHTLVHKSPRKELKALWPRARHIPSSSSLLTCFKPLFNSRSNQNLIMKLLVAFGLFSFGAAQLRPWPSWLPRFPGGTPKIPPFITIPGAERIPPRIFSGLTDPTENFHIGQDCSVQHEKREYKGTCQNEDDFSKCTWRLPERRVSLWPGAETKSTLFSSFNCVSPPKYFSPF